MLLAKLNTHGKGTWTVSRGRSPDHLMTLGGSPYSRLPRAQLCAKGNIAVAQEQPQKRAPSSPGFSLPHLDIIVHRVLLGTSHCQKNAAEKRIRGCHFEPGTQSNVVAEEKWGCCSSLNPERSRQCKRKILGTPQTIQNSSTRQQAWVC